MGWKDTCCDDEFWKFKANLADVESFTEPSRLGIGRSAKVRIDGVPKRERSFIGDVSASELGLDLAEATTGSIKMRWKCRCLRVAWTLGNELDRGKSWDSLEKQHAEVMTNEMELRLRLRLRTRMRTRMRMEMRMRTRFGRDTDRDSVLMETDVSR